MRKIMDKRMLRPLHVATYTDRFNEVVTDFVTRLRQVRDSKGAGVTVPNLDMELFHWSLESKIKIPISQIPQCTKPMSHNQLPTIPGWGWYSVRFRIWVLSTARRLETLQVYILANFDKNKIGVEIRHFPRFC